MSHSWASFSSVFLRYALGLGFLSAVADRFGLWGPFGQPNVSWGNFSRFLEYTHTLNWFVPAGMIPAMGIIATGAELLTPLNFSVFTGSGGAILLANSERFPFTVDEILFRRTPGSGAV